MKGYCPDCKAELPQEYLRYPMCGCPRCHRVIHFPDFREPLPPAFEELERTAQQAATRLARAWTQGSAKDRATIVGKLNGLARELANA